MSPGLTTSGRASYLINQLYKPGVQLIKFAPLTRFAQDAAAAPADAEAPQGADTKALILDAAFRRLAREGYAALSVREIAKDAGVNHALINYYFGSKQRLVVDVFEEANRQRLERQTSMYRGEGGFAHKWAQARRYYGADFESGFTRVLIELMVASLADPGLRSLFTPRMGRWKGVIQETVRGALQAASANGIAVPSALTAEVIATWIVSFWVGMEIFDLLGLEEDRRQHAVALDAIQHLLEALDARAGTRTAATKNPAGTKGGNGDQSPSANVPADCRPASRARPAARRASGAVRHGGAGK
jgi:AcrR family transcriptional regulator